MAINHQQLGLSLCLLLYPALLLAQDKPQGGNILKLDAIIRGSQEQPKVMTIVPWQTPTPKSPFSRADLTPLPRTLAPLERRHFLREIALHEKLSGQQAGIQPAYPNEPQ
ncbi:hypothetical protein [Neptunicella sp. SCSIO 80796]|uniref:hypothetical protein n=1 Tax=Neptunicella plasticusilytica TaxID=3117012 RepID=UPI003A4E3612